MEKRLAAERAKQQELRQELEKARQSLSREQVINEDLEDEFARLRVSAFEKQAQLGEMSKRLEGAILEVVRTKAKLRSLESKAEAASTLAEAEIAMKALKAGNATNEKDPDSVKAEQLLKLGAQEFKKENYGGSLYLTTQAKSLIQEGQRRSRSRDERPLLKGEVAFGLPVPLRALVRSNLRVGPGLDLRVVTNVRQNELLVGYSYKGQWIRVRTEDGKTGWVFYKLVGAR